MAEEDRAHADLGELFNGVVVPEATPSPRTVRFATPRLHGGPSRVYGSAVDAAGEPGAARLFHDFDAVTNVLVGPNFVAVTIARPDRWETILAPMLRAVTEEFAAVEGGETPRSEPPVTLSLRVGTDKTSDRAPRQLERAWAELGVLQADRPEQLNRVLSAARDPEPARRQVAAALLADAPPPAALQAWHQLLDDPSRTVRRSVVDAIAAARRDELRPLLHRALNDVDAWTRWKALRGIAALGVGTSRAAVETCASDPDFRVRLEAAHVLAHDHP